MLSSCYFTNHHAIDDWHWAVWVYFILGRVGEVEPSHRPSEYAAAGIAGPYHHSHQSGYLRSGHNDLGHLICGHWGGAKSHHHLAKKAQPLGHGCGQGSVTRC